MKCCIWILIFFSLNQIGNSQNKKKPFSRFENGTDICPEMKEWKSLHPTFSYYVKFPAEYVVVHHTMGLRCFTPIICEQIVRNIQIYSMNVMTFPDIKYNFVIGEDGNVYSGTGWFRQGYHTSFEIDPKSISIALIGDFSDALPTNIAIERLRSLIKCGSEMGFIAKEYKLVAASHFLETKNNPGKFIYEELKHFNNFFSSENEII